MSDEKKCDMCKCTEAKQWIVTHKTYTCGACMQEIKDMADYDSQNTF